MFEDVDDLIVSGVLRMWMTCLFQVFEEVDGMIVSDV